MLHNYTNLFVSNVLQCEQNVFQYHFSLKAHLCCTINITICVQCEQNAFQYHFKLKAHLCYTIKSSQFGKTQLDLKQHLSVHLFATGTRKPLPFAPFSFGGLLLLLLRLSLARVARVSSPQQLSCERFLLSLSFSLSLACPVAARAVRPSAHNTPLGCVWYYCHCQLVVASGASGGTFSRLFLPLSRHHILP